MPKNKDVKKVLVIGSGPIVIGQAAEFDYAGTQACRSLKEEGIEVVLVNSNPATIMTDKDIADEVYIEPLTVKVLEQIIEKEKPDSILPTLGGQAGLNLGMELDESGFLKSHGVKLLGTTAETIRKAEDRQEFKDTMEKIGEPCAASLVVHNVEDGVAFAAIYKAWGSTPVMKIDLENKTVEEVKGIADAQATLAYKDEALYVGDHTIGKEKIYVYKDGKLTGFEQPKGAQAPYNIALF